MLANRVCIIGVGLIGGSLARALRGARAVGEIVGCNRDPATLQRARELGVIDRAETDCARAVRSADVVVVATPVGSMEEVFAQIAPHLDAATIVTDVGSSKGSVIAAARNAFGAVPPTFVPGHPIAGTERSGAEASFAELFQNRKVILTPLPETRSSAVAKVRALWEAAGAQVIEMSAEHHDQVLAATSHLPHVLAYTLVHCLARMDDSREIFNYAAGGFRDFTRIASSDPRMWHDICLANRDELLGVIRKFGIELETLAKALRDGNGEYLLKVFEQAKEARDRFAEKGGRS
jgi:prephenate dehydrogenase